MSHLKQFTIQKLKIDQSFVRDIEENPDAKAIVEAIIAMSHSLNLDVIAEGVETQEQLNFLRDNKCDQIQGYWLSRPRPANEIALILKENHNFLDSCLSGTIKEKA